MFSKKKEKATITPGYPQFLVRYVGKTETFVASGRGCTLQPVQRLWDNAEEERKMRRVALVVSPQGLMMLYQESKNYVVHFDIKKISYCSAEQELQERTFAWIYKDPATRQLECHAVVCGSREKAQAISVVLSRAFQIAYKDWKGNKEKTARLKTSSKLKRQSKEGIKQAELQLDTKDKTNLDLTKNNLDSSSDTSMAGMNITRDDDELSFTENDVILDAEVQTKLEQNKDVRALLHGDVIQETTVSNSTK